LCADVFHKVNIKKNPTLADLGSRDLTRAGLLLKRHGVDEQELCGFLEREGFHGEHTRRSKRANASANRLRLKCKTPGSLISERLPDIALSRERMSNSPAAGRMTSVLMEIYSRITPSRKQID
jgi:hypothetical protein